MKMPMATAMIVALSASSRAICNIGATTSQTTTAAGSARKRHTFSARRGCLRATPSGEIRSRARPLSELIAASTTSSPATPAMIGAGSSISPTPSGVAWNVTPCHSGNVTR